MSIPLSLASFLAKGLANNLPVESSCEETFCSCETGTGASTFCCFAGETGAGGVSTSGAADWDAESL